jgi:hypothetical protein
MTAMPARETELAEATTDVAPEVAAPEPEVAVEAQLQAEGAIPDVATGAITEPGETASEQAFGDKPTAQSGEVNGGLYEPEDYQAACLAAGTPDKWDDKYARGHTEAKQWIQPYEGRYDSTFELKVGYSASQAVKDFLAGPSIAEFRLLQVAMEMDELRDELGDQKFDQLFGSSDAAQDAQISAGQRLKMSPGMYSYPFADQMAAIAAEHDSVDHTAEPEAPAVEARVEEQPKATESTHPAPEMIAEELGVQREQELV